MKDRLKAYSLKCLHGEKRGLLARLWLAFLAFLSFFYWAGMRVRSGLYRKDWLSRHRLPCRVISVGNLVAGGTGKTPFIEYLALALKREGRKVAVLIRGYKGRAEGSMTLVSNGHQVLGKYPWVGDEAYLLARNLQGIPVLMGVDRYKAGLFAVKELGVEEVLLDDGFQHLALHRDLDILLMDGLNPFGFGYLLPRGLLREPLNSIARADVLVLTRADLTQETGPLREELRRFNQGAPILLACHRPSGLLTLNGERALDVEALQGKAIVAFSGIANPRSFESTLESLGAKVLKHLVFPDHHPYSMGDLEAILEKGEDLRAEMVLTTEKDAVRLLDLPINPGIPLYALRVRFSLIEGEDALERILGVSLGNP